MQLRKTIDRILGKVLVSLMAIMVLNVLWQVISRFLLEAPSSFTDELARFLLIWLGILGAAYVSGRNLHVAIDVLPKRLEKRTQQHLVVVVSLIIILFCLFAMVLGGSRLVYITYALGQNSPALQVPLAVVYCVIPISGTIIIFYKVTDLLKKK